MVIIPSPCINRLTRRRYMISQHQLNRYNKFITNIQKLGNRQLAYSEEHHIIPRCQGGVDDCDNLIDLTFREHFLAHWMLYMAYPHNSKLANAFHFMCNIIWMVPERRREMRLRYGLTSRAFERLKVRLRELGAPHNKNVVSCLDLLTNKKVRISCFEFALHPDRYQFHTKGMTNCFDTIQNKQVWITTKEYQYNSDQYLANNANQVCVIDKDIKIQKMITYEEYRANQLQYITKAKSILIDSKWTVFDPLTGTTKKIAYGVYIEENMRRTKSTKLLKVINHKLSVTDDNGDTHLITLDEYKNGTYQHRLAGKVSIFDTIDQIQKFISRDEYNNSSGRYQTSTKGKVLAFDTVEKKNVLIDKELFDRSRYVGQTKNLTTVFDKVTGQYVQITKDQARDKTRYQGPCSGKVNIIDKITGVRSQIDKLMMDPNIHVNLGDKKYYFKAEYLPNSKIKNIHIYEWKILDKTKYEILELDKFEELRQTYFIKKDLAI